MKIEIDGNRFRSERGFYRHMEEKFTNVLGWRISKNLDAFAELLEGGFGKHGQGEEITVIWSNFQKSLECLNGNFLRNSIEALEEGENVTFEKHDYKG